MKDHKKYIMVADDDREIREIISLLLSAEGYAVLTAAMALVSIGAFALERVRKGNDKMFLYARIAAAAALIIGTANALLV